MEFKKYPSLTNDYRQKEIGYWLDKYPELKEEKYCMTEKIHGANFQVLIESGRLTYGKRTSFLSEDESFFDWQNVMKKYERELGSLQQHIINSNGEIFHIRIYGELFGGKIQKGVDYGIEKQFRVFDISINDEIKSQEFLHSFFYDLEIENLLVPFIREVDGIFNALESNSKFNSLLSDKEDNMCEGIVIKPWNKVYQNENGSIFYIKKKNEEFKEKSKESKSKSKTPLSTELLRLQSEFELYINENRLDGIFSKYGEISSERQIGDYIKYLMIDAKEDFNKDFEDKMKEIDKNDQKLVYKKGNMMCAKLIKQNL